MPHLIRFMLLIFLLLVVACGGDEPTPTPAPSTPQPTIAPTATPPVPTDTPPANTPTAALPTSTPATEAQATVTPSAPTANAIVAPIVLPTLDATKVSGVIHAAGSDVVFPLAVNVARRFAASGYYANLEMEPNGTDDGFARFCQAGDVDIVNASRQAHEDEIANCQAAGRELVEFRIATGAVVIIVNPANPFIGEGVTLEQLARIFASETTNWSDLDPTWPQEPILRFSPDEAGGTFDYFVETVMNPLYVQNPETDKDKGKEVLLATSNLQMLGNDKKLLEGVAANLNAIGYIGYVSYANATVPLKALALDGIEADPQNFHEGGYPLTRPFYLYSAAKIMQEKPQVAAFINFFLTVVNKEVPSVGLLPTDEAILNRARQQWLDIMQPQ